MIKALSKLIHYILWLRERIERCSIFSNLNTNMLLTKKAMSANVVRNFNILNLLKCQKRNQAKIVLFLKAHGRLTLHRSSKLRRNSADVNKKHMIAGV
jgi:hypothetical protein